MKDYYKILNVNRNASQENIRDNYIFFMVTNYPNNVEDNLEYLDVEEAYSVLCDEVKRKTYDLQLEKELKQEKQEKQEEQKESFKLTHTNFILEDGTIVNPQKITTALNTLVLDTRKKEEEKLDENRKIYLEAYYRSKLPIAKKYNNQNPREKHEKETAEEYQIYLDEFYTPIQEEDFEYIPNTNIARPRFMRSNETDEHYKKYLKTYYSMVFPTVEKELSETKDINYFDYKDHDDEFNYIKDYKTTDKQNIFDYENHDDEFNYMNDQKKEDSKTKEKNKDITASNGVIASQIKEEQPEISKDQDDEKEEKNKKINEIPIVVNEPKETHTVIKRAKTKLNKVVKATLFAGALILATMGIKSTLHKEKEDVPTANPTIEQEVNNTNVDDDLSRQIDEMLDEKEPSVPTIGDIINMKEGQEFFYNSTGARPSGTVGNIYTTPGNYIVDAVAIVNQDNTLVAVSYTGGISSDKLAEQYDIDLSSENYKINYHFSDNASLELQNGTANQKGWTEYNVSSYDKQSNILDEGLTR